MDGKSIPSDLADHINTLNTGSGGQWPTSAITAANIGVPETGTLSLTISEPFQMKDGRRYSLVEWAQHREGVAIPRKVGVLSFQLRDQVRSDIRFDLLLTGSSVEPRPLSTP